MMMAKANEGGGESLRFGDTESTLEACGLEPLPQSTLIDLAKAEGVYRRGQRNVNITEADIKRLDEGRSINETRPTETIVHEPVGPRHGRKFADYVELEYYHWIMDGGRRLFKSVADYCDITPDEAK